MNNTKFHTARIFTVLVASLFLFTGSALALDWTYSYDAFNDASGGSVYEVYRMGYALDGDNLYFNMLTGMPQQGSTTSGRFDLELTAQSLAQLDGEIPESILAEAAELQGVVYPKKSDLQAALNQKIGPQGAYWYKDIITAYAYYYQLNDTSLVKLKNKYRAYDLSALDILQNRPYAPKARFEEAVKNALGNTVQYTLPSKTRDYIANYASNYAKLRPYWYVLTAGDLSNLSKKYKNSDLSALTALQDMTYRSQDAFKAAVAQALGDTLSASDLKKVSDRAVNYARYRVTYYSLTSVSFEELQKKYSSYDLTTLQSLQGKEYFNATEFKADVKNTLGTVVTYTLSESTKNSIVRYAASYAHKWYELTDASLAALEGQIPEEILAQLENGTLKGQVYTSSGYFQKALKADDPIAGYIDTILKYAESKHEVINAGDLYINVNGSHHDGYVLDANGNPAYASGDVFGLALTNHVGDMNYDMQNSSTLYASGSKDDDYKWSKVTEGYLYKDAVFSTGVYESYKGAKATDANGQQLDGGQDVFGGENNAPVHIAEFGADLGFQGDVSWQKLSGKTVVDEQGTQKYNVYEVDAVISLSALGLRDGGTFEFWWAMECGNDFHSLQGEVPEGSSVPEPGTILLLGAGLLGLIGFARKRRI